MYCEFKKLFERELVKTVNANLLEHGLMLVMPAGHREDWALWLVKTSGEIVHRGIDLSKYTEGLNLLDMNGPFGFDFCISVLCDNILSEAGVELLPAEAVEG